MAIDSQLVEDYLRRIVSCGPRGLGSRGGSDAGEMIAGIFRDAGLEVDRQEFSVSRWAVIVGGRLIPLVAGILLVIAGVSFSRVPVLSTVIPAGLLGGIILVGRWPGLGSRLLGMGRQIASFNVIGRSHRQLQDRPTLVFMAHYDSKSQSLPVAVRVGTLWISIGCCAVLLVLSLMHLTALLSLSPAMVLALVALACVGCLLQVMNFSGNRSPGALDNASGISVVASLAQALPKKVGDNFNLVFVATGAEEVGMGGALRFIERYGAELDRKGTLCLNFDTLGSGGRVYLAGSQAPFEDVLVELRRYLTERGMKTRRLPILLGVGMDHMRLRDAGYWSVSLTQGFSRASLYIHSSRDTIDRVDSGQLALIADAVSDVVMFLAKGEKKVGNP